MFSRNNKKREDQVIGNKVIVYYSLTMLSQLKGVKLATKMAQKKAKMQQLAK
jgi:hypothetical protein